MSESPHLGLGYLAPSQAQKHVTVNEAFRRLDAIVQLGVLDRTRTAPPAAPAEGDRHIVAAAATGAWAGKTGKIAAFLDGGWTFIAPKPGWLAYVAAESTLVAWSGSVWAGSLASLETLTKLGVNATADTVNRFALSSQAALFNHEGAGVQVKLNKAAASDVASFLFQRGFSGRAEFGLVGSDGFSLKVSPDGAAWTTALSVDPTTGAVDLPATQRARVDKFTASGTWTKPSWATRVVVELISGGNGGGSGGLRGTGVQVSGGSGAAPPVSALYDIPASELPATAAVTVGAGGAGGAAASAADANGAAGTAGGTSFFGTYGRAVTTGPGAGGGAATASGGVVEGQRFLPGLPSTLSGGASGFANGAQGAEGPGKMGAGGGAGGGVSAANASGAGGRSGVVAFATPYAANADGGASAGAPGAAGTAATRPYLIPGGSGGGGAASAAANGGAGGDGAAPGGSGGGGGAARNGFTSGKGGDGARGEVWVTSYR